MSTGRVLLLLSVLNFAFPIAHAQQASPWQGEWGAFTGPAAAQGRRLSIRDCHDDVCKFSIARHTSAGNTGTASDQTLTIQLPLEATANLPGETGKPLCQLHFERQTVPQAAIVVTATGDTCTSYYSTSPAMTMSGGYPQRATTNYVGLHIEECYQDDSLSRIATCTHPDLAALEQKWRDLNEEYPLQPVSPDESRFNNTQKADAIILQACDTDADPAKCLTTRYSADIATMQKKKDAFTDGTVQRGDAVEGGRLAEKIAGTYRHRFQNGDVQGDKFTSTDTLTIRPVGTSSIHFDAELSFYNGHSCSISGGALYRKDGSFVFDDVAKNHAIQDTPACRLAISSTAEGVEFKDINGSCKMDYCGTRGSLDGASFTFKERTQPAKP